MRYLSKVIVLSLICSSCYVSKELPPDQDAWDYDIPSSTGLSDLQLRNLNDLIEANNFAQIEGLVIVKNDKLVFENYYNGGNRHTLHEIGRSTSLVASLLLGIFIDQGYIADVDVPIFNFLPEYQNIFTADPSKQEITFRHLLTNTMGVPWNEYTENTEQTSSDFYQMKLVSDWAGYVLSKRQEAQPGLRLVLNSGSALILSKIFSNILVNETLEEFIAENLFSPIGITNYEWAYDPSGTLDLMTGLKISTLDFMRLGYLTQQEGRWSDRRRVINRDWILDCLTLQKPFDTGYDLGYYWWIFSDQFNANYQQENQGYIFSGYRGQSIYLVPDQNLIVAVMGNNPYSHIIYNHSLYVYLRVIDALTASQEN
ncbi:MAG: hypothetical protein CMB80_17630 [Flammeovirgaceae bacterium]|nr:hypothetical protein [Flammeovirgaceae bacterium]MBE63216.1 hypothetical protein [Flammeovirgaceae bacterium]